MFQTLMYIRIYKPTKQQQKEKVVPACSVETTGLVFLFCLYHLDLLFGFHKEQGVNLVITRFKRCKEVINKTSSCPIYKGVLP